ncbi:unnamed protein product [Owenia fusiformis]|uniref:Uncharacterized protein n=1 Tax=Owenia fusiformis TaxID=6347 RepID=A0A8J1Y1S9_OWEFU|nr:unnamed protein product [Owenia fusiformis]
MFKVFILAVIFMSIGNASARRRKNVETGPGPEFKTRPTKPTNGRQKPPGIGVDDEAVSETTTTAGKRLRESPDKDEAGPESITSHSPTEYYSGYAWRASYNTCLQGNGDVTETFTISASKKADAPEKCLQLCWKSSESCWSVDYRVNTVPNDNTQLVVTCILSQVSLVQDQFSGKVDVTCCEGWVHFERVSGWVWNEKQDVKIDGTMLNVKSTYAETFETCKEACAAETEFMCMSVEWKNAPKPAKEKSKKNRSKSKALTLQKNCHLQARWRSYPVQEFSIEVGNSYAEKTVGWAWTSVQEACITGHDTKMIGGVANIEDCKDHCRNELNFVCRSVEYKDGTCRLSLADSSDAFNYKQPCGTPGTEYSQKNL